MDPTFPDRPDSTAGSRDWGPLPRRPGQMSLSQKGNRNLARAPYATRAEVRIWVGGPPLTYPDRTGISRNGSLNALRGCRLPQGWSWARKGANISSRPRLSVTHPLPWTPHGLLPLGLGLVHFCCYTEKPREENHGWKTRKKNIPRQEHLGK